MTRTMTLTGINNKAAQVKRNFRICRYVVLLGSLDKLGDFEHNGQNVDATSPMNAWEIAQEYIK